MIGEGGQAGTPQPRRTDPATEAGDEDYPFLVPGGRISLS